MTNLGSFTVNLRDSAGGRVLQMEIQVESDSEMAESIEGRMPQLRDSVILLASDYSYTELEGIDGKFRLKDDIHARVNAVLEPIQVRRVYFTEFVVQ
jgi:flagellar protein FliL